MDRELIFKKCNIPFAIATFCLTINILSYQALELADYKDVLRYVGIGLYILTIILGDKIRYKLDLMIVLIYSAAMFLLGEEDLTGNAVNMIAIILIMLAAQCIKHEDMMKIFFNVAIISIIVWFALLATGQIEITAWEAYRLTGLDVDSGNNITTRYSLGFLYEINLGAWYLTSAMTIVLAYRGIKKLDLMIVSALNIIIFIVTDSRTTFGFYFIFLISYFFLKMFRNSHKILDLVRKRISVIYIIIFFLPFITGWLVEKIPWLDIFTSGRLGGIIDRMEGMTVFNYIFGWYYLPLACFYYLLFTQFGLLVYILFYFVLRNGSKKYLINGGGIEFCLIFSMMIVGLFEGSVFAVEELSTIVFWSLIGKSITMQNEKNS